MNSIEKRRELRKKKILENAELRKEKILGISPITDEIEGNVMATKCHDANVYLVNGECEENVEDDKKSNGIDTMNCNSALIHDVDIDKLSEISAHSSKPAQESSEFSPVNQVFSSDLGNISNPSSPLFYSRLSNNSNNTFVRNARESNDARSPNYLIIFLNHPLFPCFLSFIVCLLLTLNLGDIVSHSVIIPFCIWKIQQTIASLCSQTNCENNSLIMTMLMLCGIHKEVLVRFIWIMDLLREFWQDFTLYVIVLVFWHLLVGLPEVFVKGTG